jgi:GTP pyrophosphokinase
MQKTITGTLTGDELFEKLIQKMQEYHPSSDFTLVLKAYKLSKGAHEGQLRRSGEPYIIHPVEVAIILANLELDRETVAAAILHDIIEDTNYTYEDLEGLFGKDVADLVDGVTKLQEFDIIQKYEEKFQDPNLRNKRKLRYQRGISQDEEKAENYRKLFMAMANDVRVILIKIADRIHNLRTLKFMPPEKQKSIAQESLDIYAPIAGRLGIATLRRELEDLAFKYSDPEGYQAIKEQMNMKIEERTQHMDEIVLTVRMALNAHGIAADVKGRAKHFFSIHKKMKAQEKGMDEIMDIFAIRIVVDTVSLCWQALGAVHEVFMPIPGKFKNYINAPKSNGYQSIHDALLGPDGEPFEVQIRTADMNRTAENGIAAHWKYKEGRSSQGGTQNSADEKIAWLSHILELQRENPDNNEFLDQLKGDLDIYAEFVHCYTPQGELKILTKGSTCIDFAYAIHSAVGNRMMGAKANGRIVPKDYVLNNGDRVEILTSQSAKGPTTEWLKIAKTSQAKNKIKQWLKQEDREESIQKGRELLDKAAKAKGHSLAKLHTSEGEKLVLARHSMRDFDTLCAAIGRGVISENSVANRLYEVYMAQNPEPLPDPKTLIDEINKAAARPHQKVKTCVGDVMIRGEGNLAILYSKCCGPVPGDKIIGFITRGRGIAIHRIDCQNILNLTEIDTLRLIEAEWNVQQDTDHRFSVELNILCDSMNCIVNVTEVFGKMAVEIRALNAKSTPNEAILTAAISVAGRDDLDKVSARLLSLKCVHEVERVVT